MEARGDGGESRVSTRLQRAIKIITEATEREREREGASESERKGDGGVGGPGGFP
jgi:hypothetical protein